MKSPVEQIRKDAKKLVSRKVENKAAYLARTLHNAPRRARRDPQRKRPNQHYAAASVPNRIFFPDPNGGPPVDSGLTVEQYLKQIKAFRASGHGSFQKEKVQTRVKGSTPPGTYAEKNQKPGEFFTKGTGRFSEKENARLQKIRDKKRKLEKSLNSRQRKSLRSIQRQIDMLERSKPESKRLGKLRDRYRARKEEMAQTRRKKMADFREKNRRYRIVIPHSRGNYTADPLPVTLLRQGGTDVPKTWSGPGASTRNWLAKSWTVEKVSDDAYKVELTPLGRSNGGFLQRLEYGGSFKTKPVVKGYLVTFHDGSSSGRQYSHRRISFVPMKTEPKTATVRGRGWIRAAIERVKKRTEKQ